jgi:hypothetical protein
MEKKYLLLSGIPLLLESILAINNNVKTTALTKRELTYR